MISQEKNKCALHVIFLDSGGKCKLDFIFPLGNLLFCCPTCNISGLWKGGKSEGSTSDDLQREFEIANIYISYAMHETENYFNAVCDRAHLFIHPRASGKVHWSHVGRNRFRGYMVVLINDQRMDCSQNKSKLDMDQIWPDLAPNRAEYCRLASVYVTVARHKKYERFTALEGKWQRNPHPKLIKAVRACLCRGFCFSRYSAWHNNEK